MSDIPKDLAQRANAAVQRMVAQAREEREAAWASACQHAEQELAAVLSLSLDDVRGLRREYASRDEPRAVTFRLPLLSTTGRERVQSLQLAYAPWEAPDRRWRIDLFDEHYTSSKGVWFTSALSARLLALAAEGYSPDVKRTTSGAVVERDAAGQQLIPMRWFLSELLKEVKKLNESDKK